MKFHKMPTSEMDLHERSEQCPCRPEVVVTYNADVGVTTTEINHNFLKTVNADIEADDQGGSRVTTND